MIKREKYMKHIREFYDGDLIKVITGIRRCGKSVILRQILEEIRERSDNIIFLDFEDTAVLRRCLKTAKSAELRQRLVVQTSIVQNL